MKKFTKALAISVALLMAVVCLTACVPSNVEDAEALMEELGCVVTLSPLSATALNKMAKTEEISGTAKHLYGIGSSGSINAYYFESAKDAKLFFDGYVMAVRDTFRWEQIDCKGKVVVCGSASLVQQFI